MHVNVGAYVYGSVYVFVYESLSLSMFIHALMTS